MSWTISKKPSSARLSSEKFPLKKWKAFSSLLLGGLIAFPCFAAERQEFIYVDSHVQDYQKFINELPDSSSVEVLDPARNGIAQIAEHLSGQRGNVDAIHLISHGKAGAVQAGDIWLSAENVQANHRSLAKIGQALGPNGDFLIYGCQTAAGARGDSLMNQLASLTGADLTASTNFTGSASKGGDWVLESQTGAIEAQVLASANFNHVLATLSAGDMVVVGWSALNDTITFASLVDIPAGTVIKITDKGWDQATGAFTTSTTGDGVITWTTSSSISAGDLFTLYLGGSDAATTLTDVTNGGADLSADISTSTYTVTDPMTIAGDGVFIYQDADNNPFFIFGLNNTSSTNIDGTNWGTVASPTLTNSMIPDGFGSQNSLTNGTDAVGITGGASQTDNVQYTGATTSASRATWLSRFANVANWSGDNTGTITTSIGTSNGSKVTMTPPVPTVTDARISISGATGTGGAYKIGDTVTATWNNTAGGDNNTGITGVTVDFSQFGGGAAVVASDSSNTWTATYTITAGAVDSTNRNVSVTATNAAGSTTTADTTNATADNVAPTVTDGRISISGASGTGGAFKIGDTVTATWNNTAGGDNNSDTISSVTVNFTQFGGGAAVAASNSSGTWTATYTVVAGAIDNTNRNVTVTATDNAGNATSTSDTSNATVDNIAPSVTSITPAGGAVSSDTSVDFIVDFSESVSNVSTDDFTRVVTGSAAGTIASVSAASGDPITVTVGGISGSGTLKVNLNGSTNIVDDAGNSIAAYSSGTTHTVNILTAPDAPTIGTATAGDGQVDVTFTAPGSNGGSAITTYTATASPGGATGNCAGPAACTITVGSLTNGTAYTFTVTATNAIGTSTASGASGSATPKANQTITFANPGAQNFGSTPTLSATATSSLTVSFTSSTTGVCTITSGGALTFVTAGSCTIDADQAGNGATNAAPTVSRTFTVNAIVPGAPTIGTATAGDTQADVTFTAPVNTGGTVITGYTVTSNPGGLTGTGGASPITVTGLTNGIAYTFTVTATNSAGTGAASAPSNSVTPKAAQTITFANPGTQTYGTAPNLSTLGGGASSTSGLTIAFSSSTTGVCTITTGGILTFVTAGTCTINANQAGNSIYLPAPQVSRSFTVSPAAPAAPTIGTATAGDTQASVAFTAPADTGGSSITGYTVTVSPPDVAPVNGASSPIVVNGLTNGQAYTFTVTADNVAGTGPASGASNSITPKATQTITFANPGAQNFGATPTFSATSDSGLTPTFTSSTTGVCTITGVGAVTFVTAGTCTINADQAGDSSYLAATQVTRSFAVNAVVPGAPTIGTATAGNTQATVTFTAPASNGGAAITGYTVTSNPGGITRAATASPFTFTGLTNGTSYTFTVTATNSVGTGAASAASNAVTPSLPPNSAPVIAQGGSVSVTMSEDGTPTPFSLSLSATDADSDPLTWSITSVALHGGASVSGGSVSYVPTANYHGSDSFVVQVSDGSASATTTVNVTVSPVNDLPVIFGVPTTSVDQDTAYSFTPTASDLDTGDVLTFSISNKPTWASFNTATGALTGTPAGTDSGKTLGIVISVSDGTASASLPAFDIEVISTIDPLQPIVTAPADLELNATGLYTPVTLGELLGGGPNTNPVEIEQILKTIAKDGVSGNNCCTTVVVGLGETKLLSLSPGRHEIKWRATNAVGVTGEATQIVNIKPLVSLSPSQIAIRGSEVSFGVWLNGPSPVYPLTIPWVVDASSTATAAEHSAVSGSVTFTQAGQVEVVVPVTLANVTGFTDSKLVIALGDGINAGATNKHVIDIRQGNVPPVVSLSIRQGGVNTSLVTPAGGPVTVTATVTDANKNDTHTFDWSATSGLADTDGNQADASRTFDPAGLAGSHQLQVNVTDSGGANVQASAYFRVVASLPVLDVNTDTDQDGIGDSLEGTGDTDDNGIPDYLDNMPSPNILPQQSNTTNAYLIECDPGVRCGLGLFARSGNSGGVQILDQEIGTLDDLVIDPAFEPVGGVFDFAIRDLPTPGQSVRVVIPQRVAIPANAVYRKYQRGRWVTFISDADNAVHSAAGSPGYCPPPGSADWTSGLTAGHMCVQLTIEDGGPNDDDGLVNSAVVDPGAVSEAKVIVPPEPPKPPVQVNSKGSGSVGGVWIALLGGLLMFRRIKHRHWVALVALLASHSQAQTAEGFYMRADVFSVESTQEEEDFAGALNAAGHEFSIGKYDTDRTGFQLAVGYEWNSFTYTQLGYLDLGEVRVDLLLDGDADQGAFAADLADEYPITATGATLVQGLKFGVGEQVKLGFEAGVYLWDGDVDVNGVPFAIAEDSGTDPLAGVLLDLPLGGNFTLGVGLRRVFFDKQEVNLYSFGSSYHF